MEKILLDAQHESGRSSSKSSHCDSPPRSQTPQDTNRASETDAHSVGEKNSAQSEEDYMERRREVESLLKKNSDWIWDWSSRPENVPPAKEFLLFKHPKRTTTLSMRNTSVMKKGASSRPSSSKSSFRLFCCPTCWPSGWGSTSGGV